MSNFQNIQEYIKVINKKSKEAFQIISRSDSKDRNLAIFNTSNIFGYMAITLAAINIFGGFVVTQRMLAMYKKKQKDKK